MTNSRMQISNLSNCINPLIIKKELDKYIIGQENAKKILSIAISSHYRNMENISDIDKVSKPNILIQGATGTGKTYMIQVLSKILDIPLVIVDATTFTEAGYAGKDVTEILDMLLNVADWDVKKAEKGIIYIDEIDKLAQRKSSDDSIIASRVGVQQALLKILEGTKMEMGFAEALLLDEDPMVIDTSKILFIAGGAFTGIEELSNINNKISIGFNSTKKDNSTQETVNKNFIEYGLIPEFLGRFPVIIKTNDLSQDEIKRIMIEPKNSILSKYKATFSSYNIKLSFSDDLIEHVSKVALGRGMGVRGIRNVLEELIYSELFRALELNKTELHLSKKNLIQIKNKELRNI